MQSVEIIEKSLELLNSMLSLVRESTQLNSRKMIKDGWESSLWSCMAYFCLFLIFYKKELLISIKFVFY